MKQPVRVRFAPSPTGPLHIGGVRTALFNYLFARKHQGTFILRIEDTDQNRFVEGAEAYIAESLEWLGIPYDEGPGREGGYGPYRQSERKELYRQYAKELVDSGWAYYAFDQAEALDAHRADHEKKGKTFIYNWHNREKLDNSLGMPAGELRERLGSGEPYVIRFKWPVDETLGFHDLIRGTIRIDTNTLDDKVLYKSDGMPTYHLANIVDDHLMEISHVIRGEEWLPSLALHIQLYKALGWNPPEFAHLPLIMKPSGKGKLSKRDGEKGGFPVFPLSWKGTPGYREAGYFPEAVVNFLALLGWNPGTEQELFALDELVAAFDLARVNKGGARFDPDKTKWYNHQYLQQKPPAALIPDFREVLRRSHPLSASLKDTYLEKVISLLRERADFVSDLWELGDYFFRSPESYDEKAVRKQWKTDTPELMAALLRLLEKTDDFRSSSLEASVKAWIQEHGYSFGQVMAPLRLILVGSLQGPHLFDIMELIGREETLGRIRTALTRLDG
ncbi:glutamate--tRNA ligase [Robiginitalea sp. SC105]|uniref:glutamate--tRNA ligase n=1 Tax=Robiginitalea sp. SC105 TaxID=2762332 RepID=UPI00163996A2|nr:glutamate--tRNA ligase [Robiginitalea sp. SC105]MBC2838208.1 glutamate--tRNA ligase [Robiginitalea sp. SC105]